MLLLLFSDPNYTLEGFKAEYTISLCPLNCSGAGECVQIQNEHICKCHESRFGFACQNVITSSVNVTNGTSVGANVNNREKELVSPAQSLISANYKSPLARVGHSAIQSKNLLYIFGGYDLNDVLDDLWVVDMNSNNVTQILKPVEEALVFTQEDFFWPIGRYGHAGIPYADGFLVYGGYLQGSGITDELLYYNVKERQWSVIPNNGRLPALAYHTITKAGTFAYVYGGGTRWGGFSHSLYRFRENEPADWELIYSSCCGKAEERALLGHTMTFWPSRNALVLYGGVGAAEVGRFSKLSSSIYLYLIESNTWLKIENRRNGGLPYANGLTPERAFHTAHIVGHYLAILGGYSHVHNRDETCYAAVVLVYSLECHIFLPQKASMRLDEGIFAHQSFVWKDEFVLVGGYRGYLNQKLQRLSLPFSNRTTESCADYDQLQWQCASDPKCGWCPSLKKCFETTSVSNNCTSNLHSLQCPGICSSLTDCMSCTLPEMNCAWCDYVEQCRKKDEIRDICNPKSSANKSLKYQSSDCFDKIYRLGLTQAEYRHPIDFKSPDNVRITNSSVIILSRDYAGGNGNNREVISELRGFLEGYSQQGITGKRLEICTFQAEVNLTMSSSEETYNASFNWTDHHHCYNLTFNSGKPVLLLPDLKLQIYLTAKSFAFDIKQEKAGRYLNLKNCKVFK